MTIPDHEGRYGPHSPVSSELSVDDERVEDTRVFKDHDPWAQDLLDYGQAHAAEARVGSLWMQPACSGSENCRCYKCESSASSHEIGVREDKAKSMDPIIDICLSPETFASTRRLRPSPCDTLSTNIFSALEWLVPGSKADNNVRVRF